MSFNPFPTHIPAACASVLLLALSSAPAWSGVVMDVVQWPQASGPCSGTLQACVDSRTQYTRIEIATTTAVDENIHPGVHSLWLAPAPGVQAGFAPGRRISGELVNPAGQLLAVTGLDFTDGGIDVHCSGGGHAQLVFRDLDLVNPGSSGSGIRIGASSACVAESLVYGNRINGSPDGFNAGLIDISADGGTLLASIAFNNLERHHGGGVGGGIRVAIDDAPGAGVDRVHVFANTIQGHFDRGGIHLTEGLAAGTGSSLLATVINNSVVCPQGAGNGVVAIVGAGSLDTEVINNTVSGCQNGVLAMGWSGGSDAGRINGVIANNLLSVQNAGLEFHSEHTPALPNNFNLINAASAANVPIGPQTLLAPARLVSTTVPRLRADSPAIDAASPAIVGGSLTTYELPAVDVDGLRRTKGAAPDIGAYEYGDAGFRHVATAAGISGHIDHFDHPLASPLASQLHATRQAGQHAYQPWGLYWAPGQGRWSIYHEDFSPVLPGSAWSVWAPQAGPGVLVHVGNAGNTTGASTRLLGADLYPEDILLVAYNWTPSGNYNPHPVGVFHDIGSSTWHIANLDGQPLNPSNAFNVYAQAPSPNAFRLAATAGASELVIDHPLANGSACSLLHLTTVVAADSPPSTGLVDLHWNAGPGRWSIRSSTPFVAGTAFNVVIDPAQVFDCNDRIFANGLE